MWLAQQQLLTCRANREAPVLLGGARRIDLWSSSRSCLRPLPKELVSARYRAVPISSPFFHLFPPVLSTWRGLGLNQENCEWEEEVTTSSLGMTLGGISQVLLRAWFKSAGRDQVSPAPGTGKGQRQKLPDPAKPLDGENACPSCLNAFM